MIDVTMYYHIYMTFCEFHTTFIKMTPVLFV